jgi:arginase family enzyme
VPAVSALSVPYHLDEHLPGLDLPLPADHVIKASLPDGSRWDRLAVLYRAVAGAVAAECALGRHPVVVSGDCATAMGTVAGMQAAGQDPGIDVLDPAEVPGLRYPAPGGPTASQLAAALRVLAGTGRLAAIGLACTWFPGGAPGRIAPVLAAVQAWAAGAVSGP